MTSGVSSSTKPTLFSLATQMQGRAFLQPEEGGLKEDSKEGGEQEGAKGSEAHLSPSV